MKAEAIGSIVVILLIAAACSLGVHGVSILRIEEPVMKIDQTLSRDQVMQWLDLQLKNAEEKMHRLDPGPPPPWYAPGYYVDWLPKAKLYGEAQDLALQLQKQKRILKEQGQQQVERARKIWNFGIAPIFHLLLAITLTMVSIRVLLRIALCRGMFGWIKI